MLTFFQNSLQKSSKFSAGGVVIEDRISSNSNMSLEILILSLLALTSLPVFLRHLDIAFPLKSCDFRKQTYNQPYLPLRPLAAKHHRTLTDAHFPSRRG